MSSSPASLSRRQFLSRTAIVPIATSIAAPAPALAADRALARNRIDCQSHVFCPELVTLMERRTTDPRVYKKDGVRALQMGDWLRKIPDAYMDIDRKLVAMDTAGIEILDGGLFGVGTADCPVGFHEGTHATIRFTGERDPSCVPSRGCDNGSVKGIEVRNGGILRLFGAKGVPMPSDPGAGARGLEQEGAPGGGPDRNLGEDTRLQAEHAVAGGDGHADQAERQEAQPVGARPDTAEGGEEELKDQQDPPAESLVHGGRRCAGPGRAGGGCAAAPSERAVARRERGVP